MPCETTRNGARCCSARRTATLSGRPGLSSITMASTRDGMPWSGQTNSRAVAAQKTTKTTVTTTRILRRRPSRRAETRVPGLSTGTDVSPACIAISLIAAATACHAGLGASLDEVVVVQAYVRRWQQDVGYARNRIFVHQGPLPSGIAHTNPALLERDPRRVLEAIEEHADPAARLTAWPVSGALPLY